MKNYFYFGFGLCLILINCNSYDPDNERTKVMNEITSKSILQHLDSNLGPSNSYFLNLGNGYAYPVECRMDLFKDSNRWALVIENVYYHNRDINLMLQLIYFGNCLTNINVDTDINSNNRFHVLCYEHDLQKLQQDDSYESFELVSPTTGIKKVKIRDKMIDIEYDLNKYTENGIHIREYDNPDSLIDFVSMFRYLRITNNDLFRATDEELSMCLPEDIPLIMKIDKWYHEDDAPPSQLNSYRKVAEILATGDTSLWDYNSKANTHWTNWPEAGDL